MSEVRTSAGRSCGAIATVKGFRIGYAGLEEYAESLDRVERGGEDDERDEGSDE